MEQSESLLVDQGKWKDISSIKDRIEDYLNVPGWRIWNSPSYVSVLEETEEQNLYNDSFRVAVSKDLTLRLSLGDKGEAHDLFIKAANKIGISPNSFYRDSVRVLFLEPLSFGEVEKIDKEGQAPGPANSIDRPEELIRPEDLRIVLNKTQASSPAP